MLVEIGKQIKSAFILLILLSVLTGLIYPIVITGIGALFFPEKANGSLIKENQQIIGSIHIGQYFDSEDYFWGRPSATIPVPYEADNSSGSNMGPSNQQYLDAVSKRINYLRQENASSAILMPVDLVTASGSGLDPDISPLAAYYQVSRVAKANHIPESILNALIKQHTENRTLGILGEPRVNVLLLNIALSHLRNAYDGKTT